MSEKNTDRITDIKKFKTFYIIGNTVVATRTDTKIKTKNYDHWHRIAQEDDVVNLNTDIESFDECYSHDGLTPEGKKMLDEAKAKKDEDEDED